MFGRTKELDEAKDRIQVLSKRVFKLETSVISLKSQQENIVECDTCGSLIYKYHKNKCDSRIVKTQYRMNNGRLRTEESLKEVYKCPMCRLAEELSPLIKKRF